MLTFCGFSAFILSMMSLERSSQHADCPPSFALYFRIPDLSHKRNGIFYLVIPREIYISAFHLSNLDYTNSNYSSGGYSITKE